jgi:hypothetical protein
MEEDGSALRLFVEDMGEGVEDTYNSGMSSPGAVIE